MIICSPIREFYSQKKFLIICCGIIVFFFLSKPVMAETNYGDKIIMVSMGDSYSSGEGIEEFYGQKLPLEDKVKNKDWLAHRSMESWSGRLEIRGAKSMKHYKVESERGEDVGEGEAMWYFVASSGATTKDFYAEQKKEYNKLPTYVESYNDPDYVPTESEEYIYQNSIDLPAQIKVFEEVPSGEVDYVTLTIGGNDAGFSDIIKDCALGVSEIDLNNLSKKLDKTWGDFYKFPGGIRYNLSEVYTSIQEKAGEHAEIIVAGYPKLLNEEGANPLFTKEEANLVNKNVSRFNNEIERLVNSFKSETLHFVSVEESFSGHEAYTDEPFIRKVELFVASEDLNDRTLISAYSMHPNENGAERYASCVQKKINWIEDGKQVTVSGKVVDKNNSPASSLSVILRNEDSGDILYSGTTDTNGVFKGIADNNAVIESLVEHSDIKGHVLRQRLLIQISNRDSILLEQKIDSIKREDNDLGEFVLTDYTDSSISGALKSFAEEKAYVYGKSFDALNPLTPGFTSRFDDIDFNYIPSDYSLGYEICDFDSDGQDELLVLGLTEASGPVFEMYEYENGTVVLSASEPAMQTSLPVYLNDNAKGSGYYNCFIFGDERTICYATYSSFYLQTYGIYDGLETVRYSEGKFIDHRFNDDISGSSPAPESYERRKSFLENMGIKDTSRAMYGSGYRYIYELIESPLVFAQGDISYLGITENNGKSWFKCRMECPIKEALPGQQKNCTSDERDNSPYDGGKVWHASEGKPLVIKNDSGEIVDMLRFYAVRDRYNYITETRLTFNNMSLTHGNSFFAHSIDVSVLDFNENDQTINILVIYTGESDIRYSEIYAIGRDFINQIEMMTEDTFGWGHISSGEVDGSGTFYKYIRINELIEGENEDQIRWVVEKQEYDITDTSITEGNRTLGTVKPWNEESPQDFQEGVTVSLNKDIPYYTDAACTTVQGSVKKDTSITANAYNDSEYSFYVKEINGWLKEFELHAYVDDDNYASNMRGFG